MPNRIGYGFYYGWAGPDHCSDAPATDAGAGDAGGGGDGGGGAA
jgi:hypothetical protein